MDAKSVNELIGTFLGPSGVTVLVLVILFSGARGYWSFRNRLTDRDAVITEKNDAIAELKADVKTQTRIAVRAMRIVEWQAGLIKDPDIDRYRQSIAAGKLPPLSDDAGDDEP